MDLRFTVEVTPDSIYHNISACYPPCPLYVFVSYLLQASCHFARRADVLASELRTILLFLRSRNARRLCCHVVYVATS